MADRIRKRTKYLTVSAMLSALGVIFLALGAFIEVLDIVYQNPGIKVRTLLGSDRFTYAQNAVQEENTHTDFAEFEL